MGALRENLKDNAAVTPGASAPERLPVVLVVEDGAGLSPGLRRICAFLDVAVERLGGAEDVTGWLQSRRPLAVTCALDGFHQDGCNIMKAVAAHDRSLPMLVLREEDPVLIGAADAVADLWGLTGVVQQPLAPAMRDIVDFVVTAIGAAGLEPGAGAARA